MELTKEYFDKVIKGLAGKRDLEGLVTKKEFEAQTQEINARFDSQTKELQLYT